MTDNIGWHCDWLQNVTSGQVLSDKFKESLDVVIDAARRYEKIRDALNKLEG